MLWKLTENGREIHHRDMEKKLNHRGHRGHRRRKSFTTKDSKGCRRTPREKRAADLQRLKKPEEKIHRGKNLRMLISRSFGINNHQLVVSP